MRHLFCLVPVAVLGTALLSACGDDVTQINQTGLEVVSSEDDLPKCTEDNNGVQVWVEDDMSARICVGGKWYSMVSNDTVFIGGDDLSCKTEELKDGSGLKIVCNGDSIGVVLNGTDGKAGKDGKNGEDGKDAVLPQDTLEADSERTAISLDSLVGFTQKGPFLKGSTVYLYELSDGRTLKQTNGNFTSKITSDDGRYKFSARDLVSQYAMVVVDGYYRNEVTGGTSDAPIRLTALTDMRKRSSVNVNLLTHMEFDRVYNLVTRGDSTGKKLTVKAAKRQAQKEILKQFHIELGDNTDAEDMDVFGDSDADAALLAVSVLLQGDSNASALSVLLTEISNDIAGYGEWKNKATKAKLADWALTVDSLNKLSVFSNNVEGWGLGEAPDFEKFVRNYAGIESGLGVCGSKDVPEGKVKEVSNEKSDSYYAAEYTDKSKTDVRFICRKKDDYYAWQVATDIEKDTMSFGHEYSKGDVRQGLIDSNLAYVYENGYWRHGTDLDTAIGLGCIEAYKDSVLHAKNGEWYKCVGDTAEVYISKKGKKESEWKSAWRKALQIEKDTAGLGHDSAEGTVVKGLADNTFTYVYQDGNWRFGTRMDIELNQACMKDGVVSTKKYKNDYYVCTDTDAGDTVRHWVKANDLLNDTYDYRFDCTSSGAYSDGRLLPGRVNDGTLYVCDGYRTFRGVLDDEKTYRMGCTEYNRDALIYRNEKRFKCKTSGWEPTSDSNGVLKDYRDGEIYPTVAIGTQVWMAKNLDYDVAYSACYKNSADSCAKFGRLYTWATAVSKSEDECGYGKTCGLPDTVIRGVCPEGWHLPSEAERDTLIKTTGGESSVRTALSTRSGWLWSTNGYDTFGFSALPAGCRQTYTNSEDFYGWGYETIFWTSTEISKNDAGTLTFETSGLNMSSGGIFGDKPTGVVLSLDKEHAGSVRCLMDD